MAEESRFHRQTVRALDGCGDWLKENAQIIADMVESGTTDWSITFSWDTLTDDSRTIPKIDISVSKYPGQQLIEDLIRM